MSTKKIFLQILGIFLILIGSFGAFCGGVYVFFGGFTYLLYIVIFAGLIYVGYLIQRKSSKGSKTALVVSIIIGGILSLLVTIFVISSMNFR